jgi:hypothetical protein
MAVHTIKRRILIIAISILLGVSSCFAQTIQSEKTYLRVENREAARRGQQDQTPPDITILSPFLDENGSAVTDSPALNIVGRVSDSSGISSVLVNAELTELASSGIFAADLSLDPGEQEIVIRALDNSGNISESRIKIEYIPAAPTLAGKIGAESVYYALVIGVNEYEDGSINNLDNPIRDARQLYNVLLSGYTFEEENVIFLDNARREEIIRALDELTLRVTTEDNLLIFYAGHGWWDEYAGNGYWLPSDASRENKAQWIRNSALVDYLEEIRSRHTLLIADACFGGAIFNTRTAFRDADQKAIEKLYELPSRKAMTSGTLTEVPDRSAFIRYLIERLENNPEKYLSSEQLFSSFRIAVINNSDVVPQYGEIRNAGDQGGDFIFIRR